MVNGGRCTQASASVTMWAVYFRDGQGEKQISQKVIKMQMGLHGTKRYVSRWVAHLLLLKLTRLAVSFGESCLSTFNQKMI